MRGTWIVVEYLISGGDYWGESCFGSKDWWGDKRNKGKGESGFLVK